MLRLVNGCPWAKGMDKVEGYVKHTQEHVCKIPLDLINVIYCVIVYVMTSNIS